MRIEFPDIEAVLIDWAGPALQGAGVTTAGGGPLAVSDTLGRETECVAIYRVGGTRASVTIDRPTLVFETTAATKTRAARISTVLRSLLDDLPAVGVGVCHITEIAGPANLPRTDRPIRWTFTAALDVEGDVL